MPTTSSYDIEDIIPEARTLSNSGVATGCPLCGDQQLRCWNLPGIHYTLAHCSGCGFTGNPVHLRARTGEKPYSIAATGFNDHGPQIKLSNDLPRISQQMQKSMDNARRAFQDHPEAASAAYTRLIGHPPERTQPLMGRLGWWNRDLSGQWETITGGPYLAFPEYICGDLLVRINLFGADSNAHIELPLGGERTPDGMLDMAEEGQTALVLSNPSDAGQIIHMGNVGANDGNAPIVLIRSESRPFLAHMGDRQLVIPIPSLHPGLLRSATGMPQVRFTRLDSREVADQMEYGGGGITESLHEEGMNLPQMITWAARNGRNRVLKHIESANIGKDRLCRVFMGASDEASRAMRHHWDFLDHPSLAECSGIVYRRRPDGGYDEIEGDGTPKEVSNVSMRVTERIVGPDRTLCRGWAHHQGQSAEVELEGPFTQNTQEEVLRAFAPLGVTSTPHWRCSGRRWMHINYAFSRPLTCEGAHQSGYLNGAYFLPGVTITSDGIEPNGRITRAGHNALRGGQIDRGSAILNRTDRSRMQMMMLFALGVHIMCTRPVWAPMTTYMMMSESGMASQLRRLAHSAHLTSGWAGYPRWGEHIQPATSDTDTQSGRSHVIICPNSVQTGDDARIPPTGWAMLWGALQASLTEDERPECACQMMLRCLRKFSTRAGIRYNWDWTDEWLACNIL